LNEFLFYLKKRIRHLNDQKLKESEIKETRMIYQSIVVRERETECKIINIEIEF